MLGLLLLLGCINGTFGATDEEYFKFFRNCIERCTIIGMECNNRVKYLWEKAYGNKNRVINHLRSCCLHHENREDAHPDDSFATCARINCGALLWGQVGGLTSALS